MAYGLCNPENTIQVPDTVPGTRSHWPKAKDYIPNENDKIFRQWLNGWRRKTSEDTYGKDCARRLGYSNMMLDETLELICDAAHDNLIASIDDLYKETRWHLTGKYGQTIVNKIKEINKQSSYGRSETRSYENTQSDSQPSYGRSEDSSYGDKQSKYGQSENRPYENTQSNFQPSYGSSAPIPKGRKCSSCGQVGHTKRSILCPKYVPRDSVGVTSHVGATWGVVFRVEPASGEPGPSHSTVHYSRMRLGNVTNSKQIHHWHGYKTLVIVVKRKVSFINHKVLVKICIVLVQSLQSRIPTIQRSYSFLLRTSHLLLSVVCFRSIFPNPGSHQTHSHALCPAMYTILLHHHERFLDHPLRIWTLVLCFFFVVRKLN